MSFGYRSDFLNAYEAFWTPGIVNARPLKNEIHPLWQQKHFRMGSMKELIARCYYGLDWDAPGTQMPDDLYKTIEPALRLATRLLAQSQPFFVRVYRANIIKIKGAKVLVRKGHLQGLKRLDALDPSWVPSPEDDVVFDRALKEIVSSFRLYCGEEAWTILPGSLVYAATNHQVIPKFWIYNFFSRQYFNEFASSRFKSTSAQMRHRLLFQFAMTLLHEFAHVVCRKRRESELIELERQGIKTFPEPLYEFDDVDSELGQAWETWYFGGTLYPTGFPIDFGNFGLRWQPWEWSLNERNIACMDYVYAEHVVHAASMSRLFSHTEWEKSKYGGPPLTVQLTALRAMYGVVEDRKGDNYDGNYRARLEFMHLGQNSSAFRDFFPDQPTPPDSPPAIPLLPTLDTEIDIEDMDTSFRKAARGLLPGEWSI
jgi:hypothetical protein